MKTTTYICDKCKQSKSETDIVAVDVSYKLTKPGNNYGHNTAATKKDICKQCLDKLGLLTEWPKDDVDEFLKKNSKTLEDKFIQMLEDLGVQFVE